MAIVDCGVLYSAIAVGNSNWLVAVEGHNLFNAVPVGLGQVEAAGSRPRLIAHHTEFGQRGEALSSSRHAVLPGVKQTPIIPRWCCGHVVIYPLDRYSSVCNRVPLLIFHNPSNTAMHLLHEDEHCFSVFLPLIR